MSNILRYLVPLPLSTGKTPPEWDQAGRAIKFSSGWLFLPWFRFVESDQSTNSYRLLRESEAG